MSEENIINQYFNKETRDIDRKYYDPSRIEIDPNRGVNDIRTEFDMYHINQGRSSPASTADGAGHYEDCPYYVLEVTNSDIEKAIQQLESTISYIYKKGHLVEKVAIVVDKICWERKLKDYFHIDEEDQLYRKEFETNQVFINIMINDSTEEEFPIYLYKENLSNM